MPDNLEHIPTDNRLIQLLNDVLKLRAILHQSRKDLELRDDGWKLFFFVDPAVLELYAEPEKSAGWINALSSLTANFNSQVRAEAEKENKASSFGQKPIHRSKVEEIWQATALLTGEFVFSNRLSYAFGGERQPILIAPEHIGDLIGYISRIETRSGIAQKKLYERNERERAELRHKLRALYALRRAGKLSPTGWLESTRNLIVRELADGAGSALLAINRIQLLLDGNSIASGATQREMTPDIIAPPVEEIKEWIERISAAKAGGRSTPQAIESDAVTIVQTIALNRQCRDDMRVFLLITRDRGLRSAYNNWFRDSATPVDIYALRDPQQYSPLFNVHGMGGKFTDKMIFNNILQAVEGVAAVFNSGDEFDAGKSGVNIGSVIGQLEMAADSHSNEFASIAAALNDRLADLAKFWLDAHASAIAAKSDILDEFAQDQADVLALLLNKAYLPDRFSSDVENLSIGFEKLQTGSTLIRQEIWAVNQAANRDNVGEPGIEPYRRPLPTRFTEFQTPEFSGYTLNEVISRLPRSPADAILTLQSASDRHEHLFVAAGISFEIGAWENAEDLLAKAWPGKQKKKPGDLYNEIEYFHARSLRLSSTDSTWKYRLKKATKGLKRLLDREDSDFAQLRAESELFAIRVCKISWGADFASPNTVTTRAISKAYQFCVKSIEKKLVAIDKLQKNDGALLAIYRQMGLNLMALSFWKWAIIGELSQYERRVALKAIEFIDGLPPRQEATAHDMIYPELSKIAISSNADDLGSHARKAVSEIRHFMTDDMARGLAFDMPPTDRAEFSKIRDFLARYL